VNAINAPRAVLDTNVVLDLFVWQNPEAASLRDAVQGGAIACLADAEGLAELERVLAYPKLALDAAAQARIHGRYAALVQCPPAEAFFAIIPRCSDRDDQKFLELAVRQRADLLLSRDKALLKLAKRIRKIAPQLDILTPNDWLNRPVRR
jgi:putative PIN family toxin of toxin-antitoxin system